MARLALIFTGMFMCAACGCSQNPRVEDNGPDVAQIASETETFIGKSISMRGLPVFYTAVYVNGEGALLKAPDKNGWLCMLIVNQRKVTQAILVCTRSDQPLDQVHTQKGASIRIEGPVKSFVKTDLIAFMKEKQGVDLVTNKNGQPLWIDDQLPVNAASPDPVELPASRPSGLDEDAPPAPNDSAAPSSAARASAAPPTSAASPPASSASTAPERTSAASPPASSASTAAGPRTSAASSASTTPGPRTSAASTAPEPGTSAPSSASTAAEPRSSAPSTAPVTAPAGSTAPATVPSPPGARP